MGTAPRLSKVASLGFATFFFAACTDSFLQPKPVIPSVSDDRLTLRGTVCTPPPDASGFPVKVLMVIDQSGSMCISDPPGAQEKPGLCEQLAATGVIPPGITEPARVRALKKLVDQFKAQNQAGANVQISIVPFETNVKNAWPAQGTKPRFGNPQDLPASYTGSLQSTLGKGTDYQGAMAYAYDLVAKDMDDVQANSPEELPRTRYVVVFLTDGTPYPRCAANDNLTGCGPGATDCYADPSHPERIWSDSASAGDFCNLVDPSSPDQITGFTAGTDRNQNYQIFSFVDRLMDLKQQHNIGDLRFHTVLLFNQAAVQACGSICTDIYGVYPTVAQSQYPAAAKQIATWTLKRMAERGNGVYQEFVNSDIQGLGLGALDYTSLAAPNAMKTLLVQSLTSVPGGTQRKVDSDGDGLPDDADNTLLNGTSPFIPDSDGDCLDDNFEVRHKDQGFLAGNDLDVRGCDPRSPLTPNCVCRDTDGDGLSQFTEDYLKTGTGLIDTDGDGVPDNLEVRYRLDPLTPNVAGLDTDGDGIPDLDEFLAESDPTRPDRALFERDGYQYEVTARPPEKNGSICYDFTVSNLKLVTPPSRSGTKQGYNLFKVWFASAPRSGVATDYGVWKVACAWAQYDPPGIRVPAGPELDRPFKDSDFLAPPLLSKDTDYRSSKNLCLGIHP